MFVKRNHYIYISKLGPTHSIIITTIKSLKKCGTTLEKTQLWYRVFRMM